MRRTRWLLPLLALLAGIAFFATRWGIDPEATRARLAAIAKATGIEIVAADPVLPVQTTYGAIDGAQASARELASYVPLFAEEMVLYPPSALQRSKLRRIVLCARLSFAGQLRVAIPDYEHDALYLDVSSGRHDRCYQRKTLHHEFFHVIDYRDDGRVYGDPGWAALNPREFRYGAGGVSAQGLPETSMLTDKYPGFLNHYSTTGAEEDKAEMFANMVVDPEHVEERGKRDAIVRAKAERMRALLVAFCPDLDARFWSRVRERARMP